MTPYSRDISYIAADDALPRRKFSSAAAHNSLKSFCSKVLQVLMERMADLSSPDTSSFRAVDSKYTVGEGSSPIPIVPPVP